jgi:hypothetical protein
VGTTTAKLGLYKPAVGENGWDDEVNASLDTVDETFHPGERTVAGGATLEIGDNQNVVRITAAGTVLVPTNAAVALPVGALVGVYADTTGTVTVAGDTGVTVRSAGSLFNLDGQYAEASLRKRATNEWVLSGRLA